MKYKFLLPVPLVMCLLLTLQIPTPADADVNGGTTCAVCTVALSLVDQLAEIHNETAVDALTRLCNYFPDPFKTACDDFLKYATPVLLDLILEKYNADVACQALTLCYTDPGQPECKLYPKANQPNGIRGSLKTMYLSKDISKDTKRIMRGKTGIAFGSDICNSLPGLKRLCEWIEGHINNHTALDDIDKDGFSSTLKTLRGTHWKGKDCNDLSDTVYPGTRPKNNDAEVDSDCNGIYGVNPATGLTFESDYCGNSDHKGVILLSDSAGAHFHIPGEWMTATKLSLEVFKNILMVVEDEFDWPELSGNTGYMNTTWDIIHGPTESLYHKLVERNRCNHRDYQNIGVNGADTSSMNRTIQYSMNRNQKTDQPAIVLYSLIGNDVCNGHADTIADMTTPAEMKANSLSTLKYLDTRLPNGSYVLVSGMADGRVLYENMHSRIHPLGEYKQDITYEHVYDLLNCLQISPCSGWMSSNETLRNFTSERAANLSKALEEVVKDNTFKNFKAYYFDYSIREVMKEWEAMGGEGWQLIEPIDGFHPSQNGNYMTAKHLWKLLESQFPQVLGNINPHNADIIKQFGTQGGY